MLKVLVLVCLVALAAWIAINIYYMVAFALAAPTEGDET